MMKLFERPAVQRVLGAVAAMLLLAGVAAVIARRDDGGGGGLARLQTTGKVLVTRANGVTERVSNATSLQEGDAAEVQEGVMTLELGDGSILEGRPSSNGHQATRVKAGRPFDVLAGDVLVTTAHATSLTTAGNRVTVDPDKNGPAAVRVSRSLAVLTGAYKGSAMLDSAGQTRTIPALREIEVSVLGRPPLAPRPLRLDASDGWDQRFLGSAIELSEVLDSYSRTYTLTRRNGEANTAVAYGAVLPALASVAGLDALLAAAPARTPGEMLVGAAIVARGQGGSFADRWANVFAFRDDGASWGLVALDQRVDTDRVRGDVEGALNRTPFEFASPPITSAPSQTPTTVPGSDTTPTPTTPASPTTTPPTRPPGGSVTIPPTPTLPGLPTIPPITLPPGVPETGPLITVVGGLLNTVGQLGSLLGTPPPRR